MQTVTQQLGLGLMLSTLLITVPPMAGMFFNGVMGSFSPYSVFNNSGTVPPSVNGGSSYQQQVEGRITEARQEIRDNLNSVNQINTGSYNHATFKGITDNTPSQHSDTLKPQSKMGQSPVITEQQPTGNIQQGGYTDKNKASKGENS